MGRKPPPTAAELELIGVPPLDAATIQQMRDAKVSDMHYSAIGRVAASWARFEATIDFWLSTLINLPQHVGVCLTGQMIGHRPRLDAFIALVRDLGVRSKWNGDLESFAKCAAGLAEQRNRAVHDVWNLKEPTRPIRREATARRTVRLLEIHVPTDEILSLVGNIDDLSDRFGRLANSIFVELAASPDTWPPKPLLANRKSPRRDSTELEPESPPDTSPE